MTTSAKSYRYSAYDARGVLREGVLQANDAEAADEKIWRQGLVPFETREDTNEQKWWRREIFGSNRPTAGDIASFTRELAIFAQSGIPIDDALRIVAERVHSKRMSSKATQLLASILNGTHLSDAMASHPEVFSGDFISMVRAGEASGQIATVLGELADLLERREDVRGRLISAFVYPALLIAVALVSVSVVVSVLVPNLAPFFSASGKPAPPMMRLILQIEDSWSLILLGFLLVTCIAFVVTTMIARSDRLRTVLDRLLLDIPFAGSFSADRNLARFARTLGSLLRAGVPLLAALETTLSVVTNRHVSGGLREAIEVVRDGQSLHTALEGRPGIPSVALRMIAVGEETGKLGMMLLRIASIFELQSQRRIERLMTLVTPCLTIGIAAVIGGLIFSVMSAILSINELSAQ